MPAVSSVIAELKSKATEKTRSTYAQHGSPKERILGVSMADLKVFAKTLKREQALALKLYETGFLEPMYLAGMVIDGSQMTEAQLDGWAQGAKGLQMISEFSVPWAAVDHVHARDLAMCWIESGEEHLASSGWCTYAGLLATQADENLQLAEIENLLSQVVRNIHTARNRVRSTMNGFVIAAGMYVGPLRKQAKSAAAQIGVVSVDMGATACRVPVASEYLEKVEASSRPVHKRKTIRC